MARSLRVAVFTFVIAGLVPGAALFAQRPPSTSAVPSNPDSQTVLHVLNRIAYGPRPGDIERVKAMGLQRYIEQQLNPAQLPDPQVDAALAQFPTLTMSSEELAEKYYRPLNEMRRDAQVKQAKAARKEEKSAMDMDADAAKANANGLKLPAEAQALQQEARSVVRNMMQARLIRAVDSERQLNEVLVDFWFNHFNVYAQKGKVNEFLNEYERDAIRPYVLGSFRDLLGATAHSPAMLFYLDNFQSADPQTAQRDREQRQQQIERRLRTAGNRITAEQRERALAQMQQAKQRGPNGLNENYARELMELHTLGVDGGYTQKDVQEVARVFTGWTIDTPQRGGGRFQFKPEWHDTGTKIVLGKTITGHAGLDGMREGEEVLDLLASSPATARHIAFQLAQKFVADDPPSSLVDRAAQVFLATKGNLRDVTRAIIESPEFFSIEAYGAQVKTPLDFVASAARALDAQIINAAPMIQALQQTLGMSLYGCQPPTGYKTTADAWVNTGALLARMNFGVQLVGNQQRRAMTVDTRAIAPDTTETTRQKLVDQMLAGHVSASTSATLAKASSPQQLVALLLGSPEFQKR